MSEDKLFAIVPVEGKPPADAIVVGPMSEVTEYIGGSVARNEKEAKIVRAERDIRETTAYQDEVRACALEILADGLAHISDRMDAYEARKKEHADEQQRAAEEAEAPAVEQMLAEIPDPDQPRTDDGELLAIKEPPETEKYDPDGEARSESITGLTPPDLEETVPPEPGAFTPTAAPESPYRNPAAIGGNLAWLRSQSTNKRINNRRLVFFRSGMTGHWSRGTGVRHRRCWVRA
jgi:hypothetical protein